MKKMSSLGTEITNGLLDQIARALSRTVMFHIKYAIHGDAILNLEYIDPDSVKYATVCDFDVWKDIGEIKGGNWDLNIRKFEELDTYKSIKMRYCSGYSWKCTPVYERAMTEINQGRKKWGCKSEAELLERFSKLDSLYDDMKNNGYKSQMEIANTDTNVGLHSEYTDKMKLADEVSVSIGRNGRYLFNDGRHRLSMAKILGIDQIPVIAVVKHEDITNQDNTNNRIQE